MKRNTLQRLIRQIVAQIVSLTSPRKIILFGSAATGRIAPHSDLDFLVVVPDNTRPGEALDRLNVAVRREAIPCDFLVTTPSVLKKHRHNPGLIYGAILKQGREIYVAWMDQLPKQLRIPPALIDLHMLTKYAVQQRYPSESLPITRSDLKRAVQQAEETLAWAARCMARRA